MKAKDLINELLRFPPNSEVCIGDMRKNAYNADDEGNGIGIYPDFTVEHMTKNVNKPFISLTFDNEDYTEGGELSEYIIEIAKASN